ncbi:hypothetical protein [Thermotoga neapolitana]|uniref:Uncharacterized protein n=1 Tax=Thermotoga neapolitana (strain ATCC 49049 / DSM 4359 / NBRC 107923 / NS-E) TaxID=309803 RepID=B9KA67_THENN|nr:hypothetical protein [Thermotoga neapolitana]ACM23850.1 Putative uncharacterized protein [Thermotoga neapolitana DSM 4359]KFZ21045.1 hypothetical protein LA10_08893 [Thermotoga neapolitana LA10]HBF10734.1 hypothetical protein [Thermotoga neapolitana]
MIRPVDFQGFVVKGVESTQSISQTLNQQALMQQIAGQHLVQQFNREQSMVKRSVFAEGVEVRTSTEGKGRNENRSSYNLRIQKRKQVSLREESKGLFMDVRT